MRRTSLRCERAGDLGGRQRVELGVAAHRFLAPATGAVRVDHEVADHRREVNRQRGAALPQPQGPPTAFHQPLEEGLKDVVDVLALGARADAVINEPAVAAVEFLHRARPAGQHLVHHFDI
jgi:hypothetical protein